MIFVCGNEPADQDKQVGLESVAKMAVEKDIIINTIYCTWPRAIPGEVEGWLKFAKLAEGRFAQIDMKKGTVAVVTPHDKKIAELSKKRHEYIKDELKKNDKLGDRAFDEAVRGTLREQATKKGFKIPD